MDIGLVINMKSVYLDSRPYKAVDSSNHHFSQYSLATNLLQSELVILLCSLHCFFIYTFEAISHVFDMKNV